MQFRDEYDAKMTWALGDCWESQHICNAIAIFNLRHPEYALKKVNHDYSFPVIVQPFWENSSEYQDFMKNRRIENKVETNDPIDSDNPSLWDSFLRVFGLR